MARIATALVAVTLALTLAGCSSPASTPGDTQAGSTPAVTTPATDGGGGDVDCTALSGDDAATYTVGIQLLAQIRSQDTVDSMKGSGLTYDPEAMDRILTKLKSLAGHGVLGDPGPDVDFYLEANGKARDILAVSGPVPQSMFDDLIAFEGDVGDFITRQISISAAYDEACG
jgi:hypothetical protein